MLPHPQILDFEIGLEEPTLRHSISLGKKPFKRVRRKARLFIISPAYTRLGEPIETSLNGQLHVALIILFRSRKEEIIPTRKE